MWLLLTLSFLLASSAQDGDKLLEGDECTPHSQPWQVALYERGRFNCGASLISPHWVLSAAHCQTRFMRVRLGEHNLRKRDGPEQLRTASRVIPHPRYEARSHRHDIMLLRLVQPARLTPQGSWAEGTRARIYESAPSPLSSPVSLPDTLHCANISIISDTSCDKSYPGRLTNTMVCAGAEGRGAESCEGDSGGPLVCGGVLQGIVSWGDVPCDNTTKPGVYTKVCHYLKWIRETMKRN
ncbi:PREDICTED: kallikrein-15 isoform X2 [Cercocebus atys]|uniref:kallikrein-15 isoform X2 n=1 Tax=Cercocebus atys TaxID=9531 RepID=UPI0005F4DFB1|nr:PREDICTED: kallikrein-15 isoform X2 [Cercocebus atys]